MAAAAAGAAAAESAATGGQQQQASTPRSKGSLGRQAIAAVDSGEVPAGGAGDVTQAAEATRVTETNANPFANGQDPFAIPEDEQDGLEVSGYDDPEDKRPAEAAEEQPQQEQSRSQKRIRTLIEKVKEQTAANQQLQSQLQQQAQYSRQAYEANQRLQKQMHQQQIEQARIKAQLEMMPRQNQQQANDPVEQFRRETIEKALGQAEQKLSPQVKQALQEVNALKQSLAAQAKQAEQAQLRDSYNQQADAALARHVQPFMTPTGYQELGHRMGSYIIQEAMLSNTDFDSAAKNVRNFLLKAARDIYTHRTKQGGDKVAAAKQIPAPAPRGRGDAKVEEYPPWDRLRKNGYKDYMAWEMKGRPRLK
jgi:hypothetical protein